MPTIFEATPIVKKPAKAESTAKKASPTMAEDKGETTMTPLTAYAMRPRGIRFETQEEEEEVVLFLRQHVVVNVPWIILSVILIFAPTLLFPLFWGLVRLPIELPVGYVIVGTMFWYLATLGFILGNFLHWYFNIYIVTNKRIVDIDFKYLLYKEFSEAGLTKVQDITYTTGGLPATIFDYGHVLIQTASEIPNIDFAAVPHPARVVQIISELIGKKKNNV